MAVAVVKETGAFNALTEYLGVDEQNPSVWTHGVVAGVISTVWIISLQPSISSLCLIFLCRMNCWKGRQIIVAMACIGR